jgi:CRP-like cAMP-binding protein
MIVAEGDAEAGTFLITRGRVRSSLGIAGGKGRSLGTLTPGAWLGQVHVATGNPHPLTMHAEGAVDALELTREEWERIRDEDPELRAAILSVLMFATHDQVDRLARLLATGRVALR